MCFNANAPTDDPKPFALSCTKPEYDMLMLVWSIWTSFLNSISLATHSKFLRDDLEMHLDLPTAPSDVMFCELSIAVFLNIST